MTALSDVDGGVKEYGYNDRGVAGKAERQRKPSQWESSTREMSKDGCSRVGLPATRSPE